ncbi:MAG: undecaprenyldiphospho-muramoylpentapeptide beta-N-acetylglucosaminyltransferase [Deltaproteobacteria bacterium]|nr:undecaprenyldiphospho-muramoylpentapeptide beta-N-acetylglucosaminyltransferase [Deltaproteobacteria bacterium]
MKIVIAGGGTGGHLFPALALADEFKRRDGSTEIIFVGSERGFEKRIVPSYGYPLETLDVEGLKKRSGFGRLKAVFKAARATLKAFSLLRRLRPNGVIGSGSYSSGPAVLAASLLGIKTAILEQNALPGLTNRILGRFVDRIYIAFEEAQGYFKRGNVMVTGNPVRRDILNAMEEKRTNGEKRFSLLVFGGSQGAAAVNAAFLDAVEYLTDIWGSIKVTHQTGKEGYGQVESAYKRKGLKVELFSFITDMAKAYSACDMVVCRAGATSIAEMTALGLPSILVPYPFSTDGHQEVNAKTLADKGAAVVLSQDALTGSTLAGTIRRFFDNPLELKKMKDAAKTLARPRAAETIADDYMKLLGGNPSVRRPQHIAKGFIN